MSLTLDKKKDRRLKVPEGRAEDFKCWHCVGLKGGQKEWCVDNHDLEAHKHDLDVQKIIT